MLRSILLAATVGIVATDAKAQHIDILVARDATGTKLVSGAADISNGNYTVGPRVFGADFGEDPMLPHLGSDPGYNAVANPTGGIALPGSTPLSFGFKTITIGSTTSNLFFWDGTGAVNFTAVPAGYSFTASKSGGFSSTVTGTATNVAGFNINTTGSNGFLHKHLDFQIDGNGGNPADGIYLVSQQFHMSGMVSSDPIFLVFNHGLDEMIHDNAVEWTQTNLAPVPEPGSVLLVALLGIAPWVRRSMKTHREPNVAPE